MALDLSAARLVPQTYGIAGGQTVFGGPRGIWLECGGCSASHKIAESRYDDSRFGQLTDAQAAQVFQANGWTGDGDRMLQARCPKCSSAPTQTSKD